MCHVWLFASTDQKHLKHFFTEFVQSPLGLEALDMNVLNVLLTVKALISVMLLLITCHCTAYTVVEH